MLPRTEFLGGEINMRLYQRVSAFITRRAPEPVCDACVADHLALSPSQVSRASARVRTRDGFRRFAGRCSGCCTDRTVMLVAAE